MKIHLARAGYGLTISDGNYGSERAEAFLEAIIEEGEEPSDVQRDLMELCRHYVREVMRRSGNERIRRAVPPLSEEDSDTPF